MNPLPDKFLEDENALSCNTQAEMAEELPPEAQRKQGSTSPGLMVALVAVVSNVLVFFMAVEKPAERIQSLFGGKSISTATMLDAHQVALQQIQTRLVEHTTQLATCNMTERELSEQSSDIKNELMENNSRLSQLEQRYQELKADIDVLNKPKPVPKPAVMIKPQVPEKPQIVVTLGSIRIQGGAQWISLREAADTSPLLTIGDEWHGAKVVMVDPVKKEAQLLISGISTRVTL